ncbi:YceH family protein [Pleionea sediminis]|uniref:YceH family protein n=1 Tax=Pleionea sediminis TaxID=2569479 RepID=UPI001186A164|nr:YceH family protein [Pleionea sediminis]
MEHQLSLEQQRVIGCLLEKEVTTPDQYPLSLNALVNACNQKSNREPVMNLTESDVQNVVDELTSLHLVTSAAGFGSRVAKYQHRFCNTEFGDLKLSDQEKAIICVMFLRGPQTPGELRTRTQRMCSFESVVEVEETLRAMAGRPKALVVQLAREPGKREARWGHLMGELKSSSAVEADDRAVEPSGNEQLLRIESLENKVAELQEEIQLIKQQLAQSHQYL